MRSILRAALIVTALLALTTPALAGGWAVVTLDSLPKEVRAGQALRLGFMVRQHGQTPIDTVEPTLLATNTDTREKLQASARKEGPKGHFVVDVTFPNAGTWEWEIVPAPFAGTQFEPLTVLPAAAKPADSPNTQPNVQAAVQTDATAASRASLRWAAIFLLIVAAALGLLHQRGMLTRLAAKTR